MTSLAGPDPFPASIFHYDVIGRQENDDVIMKNGGRKWVWPRDYHVTNVTKVSRPRVRAGHVRHSEPSCNTAREDERRTSERGCQPQIGLKDGERVCIERRDEDLQPISYSPTSSGPQREFWASLSEPHSGVECRRKSLFYWGEPEQAPQLGDQRRFCLFVTVRLTV